MRYFLNLATQWVYVLSCFFLFCDALSAQSKSKNELLWEISGNGLESPSYLFGTMHLSDSRVFEVGDSVLLAIDACDKFALEIHPDSLMSTMFDFLSEKSDENTIKDLLTEEEYASLSKRFKEINGYDLDQVANKNPMLLQFSMKPDLGRKDDFATFLDAHLYGIARTRHKEILGLEDLEVHMKYFDKAGSDVQRKMMLDFLKYTDEEYKQQFNALIEVYKSGNLPSIDLIAKDFKEDPIMTERNRAMVASIIKETKDASLFSAVGAAHLNGNNGVISLLREKGYKLRPVTYINNNLLPKYPIKPETFLTSTYVNEKLGFKHLVPSKMIPLKDFGEFELNMSVDMATNHIFSSMAMDVRGNIKRDNDAILESFVNSLKERGREVLQIAHSDWNGRQVMDVKFEENKWTSEVRILQKDGILYFFNVLYKIGQRNDEYIEAFYKGVEFMDVPELVSAEWRAFVDKQGAMQIMVPGEMTYVKREIPNDIDPNSGPYVIHINYYTNKKTAENFFVAYNDHPTGYYLENVESSLQALRDEYELTNVTMLTDFEPIEINGITGKEAELMIQDKYYSRLIVFVRGNRVYRIFKQNLIEGQKSLLEDGFFSSLTFLPYEKPETRRYVNEQTNFSMLAFDETIETVTSDSEELAYYTKSQAFASKNPKSGAAYLTEVSTLGPYFRIENLDSFYNEMSENFMSWNDTLINRERIEYVGEPGLEFRYWEALAEKPTQSRFALVGDKMILQYVYANEEELNSPLVEEFFNSVVLDEEKAPYDYYSSKIDVLIKDLYSEGSSEQSAAKNALMYYALWEDEVNPVLEVLNTPLADDTLKNGGTRDLLLEGVTDFLTEDHFTELKRLYQDADTKDGLKSQILLSNLDAGTDNGRRNFFELFLNDAPTEPKFAYKVLNAFRDSMEIVERHLPFIISLNENEDYRAYVLDLLRDYVNLGEDQMNHFRENEITFSANVLEDLKETISASDESGLPWYAGVSEYLELMKTVKGLKITDEYTEALLGMKELIPHYKNAALTTRIENGLSVEKPWLKEALDSMNTRFPTIVALQNAEALKKTPKKYLKMEQLTEAYLKYKLYKEEDDPSNIKLSGTIGQEDLTYYVYEVIYDYNEEPTSYLCLVGPVPGKSSSFDYEQLEYFSNWELTEENWREQARSILTNK